MGRGLVLEIDSQGQREVTRGRLVHLNASHPYLDLTLRFVVPNLLIAHTAVMLSSNELIDSDEKRGPRHTHRTEKVLRGACAKCSQP
jgi:hypothetical protein